MLIYLSCNNYVLAFAEPELEGKTEYDICTKRYLKDIVIVEIYFGAPFITKLKRDVQTSTTGKIANIGENSSIMMFDFEFPDYSQDKVRPLS
jgi:hypothetical protein